MAASVSDHVGDRATLEEPPGAVVLLEEVDVTAGVDRLQREVR
jgi:hypothetical protein